MEKVVEDLADVSERCSFLIGPSRTDGQHSPGSAALRFGQHTRQPQALAIPPDME